MRNDVLLGEGRPLAAEVKDFRLGLEVSVIQSFADRIVSMLTVRDPLSERVHLKPVEFMFASVGAIGSEIARRTFGKGPVSKPAPRA